MLWKFTNINKYGNLRSRIVHSEGALKVGRGFGSFQAAQRFRYESRSPYFGLVEIKGSASKATGFIRESKNPIVEVDPMVARWQKLAGIK